MRLPFRRAGRGPRPPDIDPFADHLAASVEGAFAADTEALGRVRLKAVAAFRARAAARPVAATAHRRWPVSIRPAAVLVMGGILLVGSFGVVAANSGPGQPFYGVRLALEELTLPDSGAPRLQREVARLEDRLAEARGRAQAGDAGGVAAALDAYRNELSEAVAEVSVSGADVGPLLDALAIQEAALEALASIVPAAARAGLERAIEQAGHADDVLRSVPPASPPADPPGQVPSATPDHTPNNGSERTPHPTGKPPDPGQPSATPPGWSHRPTSSPGPP
jgi:hypothetical protein